MSKTTAALKSRAIQQSLAAVDLGSPIGELWCMIVRTGERTVTPILFSEGQALEIAKRITTYYEGRG